MDRNGDGSILNGRMGVGKTERRGPKLKNATW